MQLTENKVQIERSESFSENTFKIRATGKAFRILSSGLYSDKTRAILRELGTNAADSHIMAGCPTKPFRVHLPNNLEPFFSIRDFGTGLSSTDIEGIYTTYFESNKTRSNDVTGCLGLGSKSPFSYTDSFTVTSWFNGTKYVYTAFINEHGIPSVAKLLEEATQEPNGLEVQFPVKSVDFSSYAAKAKEVYTYFSVRPEIVGTNVIYEDKVPTYTGSNWQLFKNDSGISNVLVMGNVAYPIDLHEAECYNSLFNSVAIRINCPIGAAEMTASRESLEYTDLTKTTIKQAVNEALDRWTALILDDLAKQPTYWDACVFYKHNSLWIKKGTTWQGREVKVNITLSKGYTGSICKSKYGDKVKYSINQTTFEVNAGNSIMLVDDDLPRGTKLRVMKFVREANYNKPYVFIVKQPDCDALAIELDLPAGKVIKASTLPKVKYNKTGNAGKKFVYRFNKAGYKKRDYWTPQELKNVSGGTYVKLDMYDIEHYGSTYKLEQVMRVLEAAGTQVELYGVRKSSLKKVINNSAWVPLQDVVRKVQAQYAKDLPYIERLDAYLKYAKLIFLKNEATGIDLSEVIAKIEYAQEHQTYLETGKEVLGLTGAYTEVDTLPEIEALREKYPLVFCIMERIPSSSWPVVDMVNYIKLVNEKKEAQDATVHTTGQPEEYSAGCLSQVF
jgi:hypothetical protein